MHRIELPIMLWQNDVVFGQKLFLPTTSLNDDVINARPKTLSSLATFGFKVRWGRGANLPPAPTQDKVNHLEK